MSNCQHEWVNYQPLKGESFECCKHCPMTKAEYNRNSPIILPYDTYFKELTTLPINLTLPIKFTPTTNLTPTAPKFASTFANLIKPGQLDAHNSFGVVYNCPHGRNLPVGASSSSLVRFTLPQPNSISQAPRLYSGIPVQNNPNIGYSANCWIPEKPPVQGDMFCGVDRTADPVRLAGIRYNNSGYAIEELIINALAFSHREGATPDIGFLSPGRFQELQYALGARVQYRDVENDSKTYRKQGIYFPTAWATIVIVEDFDMHDNLGYLLTIDTWFYCPIQMHVWTVTPGLNTVFTF